MDAVDERPTRVAASAGLRIAAAALDLAVALTLAIAATIATLAAVIAPAMEGAGAVLPSSPVEATLYLLFPVFEVLAFTPAGLVAPATASGFTALSWLSRRGILSVPSPGALLLGAHRLGRGGSPS
jgi:hypothetical protein